MGLKLSTDQMSAGRRQVQERFIERVCASLSRRYDLPKDDVLYDFVDRRRAEGLRLGFESDLQIADFAEACLVTRDAILSDPYFADLMQRPMMRAETKAETMLRRWIWPHPDWRPELPQDEDM